jgi:hypothetical protein
MRWGEFARTGLAQHIGQGEPNRAGNRAFPASHLRTELCSYCDMPLDPDGVPLILWNPAGWVAEFCDACVEHWFGVTRA